MGVNLSLGKNVETIKDYLDDPNDTLAYTDAGLLYRLKLRVVLSYKSAPGEINQGSFKNVQIDLKLPKGILCETKTVRHETLELAGGQTPPTEQIYLYAQKHMLPNDLNIEATLTYQ